jgi:murein DD-endopeptidase MepM/ murein hydrolase activator NlpD
MQLKYTLRQAFYAFSILIALFVVMPEGIAQSKKGSKTKTTKKKNTSKKKRPTSNRKKKSRFKSNKTYRYPVVFNVSKKTWITEPGLDEDSAQQIANYLLSNDSTFVRDWSNANLFTQKPISDTADELIFNLLKEEEKFTLTWYGRMNSVFGYRWGKQHQGLDLNLNFGDSVVSAFDGIVRYAKPNSGGYGNCIVIRHKNGLETLYGHLNNINVSENQYVKSGQFIGIGGSTGHSTGPHLHFETRYHGIPIDPQLLIDLTTQQLKTETVIFDRAYFIHYKNPTTITNNINTEKRPTSKSKMSKKGIKSGSKKKVPVKKSSKKKPTPIKKKASTGKKPVVKKAPVKKAPVKKKR